MLLYVKKVNGKVLVDSDGIALMYPTFMKCGFPECSKETELNTFITVSKRQAEIKLYITMAHGSGPFNTKCQTQIKVDHPVLKAIQWTLWKNSWQRSLKEMELSWKPG